MSAATGDVCALTCARPALAPAGPLASWQNRYIDQSINQTRVVVTHQLAEWYTCAAPQSARASLSSPPDVPSPSLSLLVLAPAVAPTTTVGEAGRGAPLPVLAGSSSLDSGWLWLTANTAARTKLCSGGVGVCGGEGGRSQWCGGACRQGCSSAAGRRVARQQWRQAAMRPASAGSSAASQRSQPHQRGGIHQRPQQDGRHGWRAGAAAQRPRQRPAQHEPQVGEVEGQGDGPLPQGGTQHVQGTRDAQQQRLPVVDEEGHVHEGEQRPPACGAGRGQAQGGGWGPGAGAMRAARAHQQWHSAAVLRQCCGAELAADQPMHAGPGCMHARMQPAECRCSHVDVLPAVLRPLWQTSVKPAAAGRQGGATSGQQQLDYHNRAGATRCNQDLHDFCTAQRAEQT